MSSTASTSGNVRWSDEDTARFTNEILEHPAIRRGGIMDRWTKRNPVDPLWLELLIGRAVFRELGDAIERELLSRDDDSAYVRAVLLDALVWTHGRGFCYGPAHATDRPIADDPRVLIAFTDERGGQDERWEFRWNEKREISAHRLSQEPTTRIWPTPTVRFRFQRNTSSASRAEASAAFEWAPRHWLRIGATYARSSPGTWESLPGSLHRTEH